MRDAMSKPDRRGAGVVSIRPAPRLSAVNAARRQLIKLLQIIDFGVVEDIQIIDGNPSFAPPPRIVREIRFAVNTSGGAPLVRGSDFVLKVQQTELLDLLDRIGTGVIASIEVRHGLPFRATLADTFQPQDVQS